MPSTITQVSQNANDLFDALTGNLVIDTTLPNMGDVDLDIDIPDVNIGDLSSLVMPTPITLDQLTTGELNGTGVFDKVMSVLNKHIAAQAEKGRITGKDFSEVYLGGMQSALSQSVQFCLGRDGAYWAAVLGRGQALQASVGIAEAQATVVKAKYEAAATKLGAARVQVDAYTAQTQYTTGKMGLASGFAGINQTEAQTAVATEQVDSIRADTKDTLQGGGAIMGLKAVEKQTALKNMEVATQQVLNMKEQVDTARAQTKNTLYDGGAIAGIMGEEKKFRAAQAELTLEQVDAARGQTKNTNKAGQQILGIVGAQIELTNNQADLAEMQYETQRAQVYSTMSNGTPIGGVLQQEILLKTAQAKLMSEQYESQRAQSRGSLSTGEAVAGVLGAQIALYRQQTESYKQDAMYKGVKAMLDTWTARKSLDDGVQVPANIDTAAINSAISTYRTAVGI